jgi:hypothetical protein
MRNQGRASDSLGVTLARQMRNPKTVKNPKSENRKPKRERLSALGRFIQRVAPKGVDRMVRKKDFVKK